MKILKILFLLWSVTTLALARRKKRSSTATTPSPVNDNQEECICLTRYKCDSLTNDLNIIEKSELQSLRSTGAVRESCTNPMICCHIPNNEIPQTPSPGTNTALPNVSPAPVKGCGYSNPNGLDSTINPMSNETQFGEFPWVVALLAAGTRAYLGVGVLIHPQVVLTVAHNVYQLDALLMIRAGEWDVGSKKEPLKPQERNVDNIVIRHDFVNDPENVANDIALLRLLKPLQLEDHINVICLPNQNESFDGNQNCVANGWGKDSHGFQNTQVLKKVELDMVSTSSCNEQIGRWKPPGFQLHESIVCAGRPGQDMCQGDGGAPLACPIEDGRYTLSGLVVSGIDCFQLPGLYTRVSIFRQWIDDIMGSWGFNTHGNIPFKASSFRDSK